MRNWIWSCLNKTHHVDRSTVILTQPQLFINAAATDTNNKWTYYIGLLVVIAVTAGVMSGHFRHAFFVVEDFSEGLTALRAFRDNSLCCFWTPACLYWTWPTVPSQLYCHKQFYYLFFCIVVAELECVPDHVLLRTAETHICILLVAQETVRTFSLLYEYLWTHN